MALHSKSSQFGHTKIQLVFLWLLILLAVDSLNPVKIVLHVFPWIAPWHVASCAASLIGYILVAELKEILYYATKVFFHVVLSIFFRDIEAIGLQNAPHPPAIFVVNHANQFIDGVVLMTTCPNKISLLVAEKSWRRRVIGDIAWLMGCVPIKRPQDSARRGTGTARMVLDKKETEMYLEGTGTRFTKEFQPKDKVRMRLVSHTGTSDMFLFKVAQVVSDVRLRVDKAAFDEVYGADFVSDVLSPNQKNITFDTFDVLKYVDHSEIYSKVIDLLSSGGSISIFPEGGSHDRTDLLPLKVGVALIAYAALDTHDINVPIVPVGLNYFRAHRFRARAVVEYGTPIYIDTGTLAQYQKGGAERRRACGNLMDSIEDSMRSVIVTTPDYAALRLIYAARRLFVRRDISAAQKQDLNRRFADGYTQILQMDDPPAGFLELKERIEEYQEELSNLGIKDYQVPTLGYVDEDDKYAPDEVLNKIQIPYKILHMVLVLTLSSIPFIMFNMPVGLAARYYGKYRRAKALSESKVKVRANDVRMSEMVKLSIVLVPSLWAFYATVLLLCTDLDRHALAVVLFLLPVCSYVGVFFTEAGVIDFKDLRPYLMRLYPSTRKRMNCLPRTRRGLERELRAFIKEHGPKMGEIFYDKEVDWKNVQEQRRLSVIKKD